MPVPDVSVILPTFNRLAKLPRAVGSVLAQTHVNMELIVVDDASNDGSPDWLRSIADARVSVLHLARNSGPAVARNTGIRAARAALVAFQDSDDEWTPVKLERQLARLRRDGGMPGWIGGAYRVGDQVVSSPALISGTDYESELLVGAPFVTPTWLVRRELLLELGGFDESLPCLEDWDLIFRLAARCRFAAVEDVVLVRHGSADSVFGDVVKRRAGLQAILERHRARWLRSPQRYARWCLELARLHGLLGDPSACARWLREALRHDPLQWRAAGLLLATLHPRLLRRLARSRFAAHPVTVASS
jgi:glycosyltransferase involved in cell wall biosynthesis